MFEEERESLHIQKMQKMGEYIGFLGSFFLSTSVLFLIITWTKKIPASWSYFHIVGIIIIFLSMGYYLHEK